MNDRPRYAVALALGPVGRFISAGRRSRDLWYGSRLISELTRRVARHLQEHEADLWTPRPERLKGPFFELSDLRPHEGPVITNKIRAILSANDHEEIKTRLATAEDVARSWLHEQLKGMLDSSAWVAIDRPALEEQSAAIRHGDFMEFYAGYALVDGGDDGERRALERAQELRDARKGARIFVAPSWTRPGHSRSTMEPGRDSILLRYPSRSRDPAIREKASQAEEARNRLGIRSDERLDAIALLRRVAAMRESLDCAACEGQGARLLPGLPFPPLSRVTADPWIDRVLKSRHKASLDFIRDVLVDLEREERGSSLSWISSPSREPGVRDPTPQRHADRGFPYDATCLFEGSIEALRREVPRHEQDAQRALNRIEPHVRRLHGEFGPPSAYYVLLSADGDGIGHVLCSCRTREQEALLVGALDRFADNAWKIVSEGRGVAFYIGGDELCAYLPVDKALDTARALAESFGRQMEEAARGLEALVGRSNATSLVGDVRGATLSLGLVVAHVKHDLRDVRERATEVALGGAKRRRREAKSRGEGSLSWIRVVESTAGGADRACEAPTEEIVARIHQWKGILGDKDLSMAIAHGLLADLDRYATAGRVRPAPDTPLRAGLHLALGNLLLRRRRSGAGSDPDSEGAKFLHQRLKKISALVDDGREGALMQALVQTRGLAHEVILAQRIAAAERPPSSKESR